MSGDWYPNLVKVFNANLRVENGLVYSRMKGVNIKLDETIWTTIAGFRPNGYKSHLGASGINKLEIYKDCLRFPDEPRYFFYI